MHHVAIMKPSWNLIPKIVSGQKTIESRWYKNKSAPWNRVTAGDTVWFKNAGGPVTARATVARVIFIDDPRSVKLITTAKKFGGCPGICFASDMQEISHWISGKRYGILLFLKHPQSVKPFHIDKTGFGAACAWMCVKRIRDVTKK